MDVLVKSVKFVKKGWLESQEDFKERVCTAYNDFLTKYVVEGGIFYDYLKVMKETSSSISFEEKSAFENRAINFINLITPLIALAEQTSEVPVPDENYFLNLLQVYQKSNKSDKAKIEMLDKFEAGLNEMIRQMYYYCDKFEGII